MAVFSCQKQPASLTTTLVKSVDPTALVTSASATPLQSEDRNSALGERGVVVVAGVDSHPTSAQQNA